MTMTDPIADMLTRIRNGNIVYQSQIDIPGSTINRSLAQILKDEGFIRDYHWLEDNKQGVVRVFMKYGPNKTRVIRGLRRVSKPGLRVYVKKHEIPRVLGGLGIAVLSTPKGMMVDRAARKEGLGGEVLCYVW